jgi:hypothetical protein
MVENVGEGLFKSHLTTKNTIYLCNVFRDMQPISERAILRNAGANNNMSRTRNRIAIAHGTIAANARRQLSLMNRCQMPRNTKKDFRFMNHMF